MKIKGIKQGKVIKLVEDVDIPDGSEVVVEIQDAQVIGKETNQKRLYELLDSWEGKEEFLELLMELGKKHHFPVEVNAPESQVIEVAISGEEVLIKRNNHLAVKVVSTMPVKRRPQFGSAKGLVKISDDFDEPLEDFKDYM